MGPTPRRFLQRASARLPAANMGASNASSITIATEQMLQDLSASLTGGSSSEASPSSLCPVSLSSYQTELIPVLYCLIFILGLVGNSLVIIVLCQERSLKNLPTIYILNLAAVDLLALATLPLWAAYYAYGYNWLFGPVMCKVSSSLLSLTTFASIFFITCMSLNRHQAIFHPFQSQRGTLQRAVVTVLLVWGLATLASLPTFYFRDTQDIANLNVTACVLAFPAKTYSEWSAGMALMKNTVGFLIPLAVIVTCYIRIGVHLMRAQRFGRNKQKTDRVLKLVAAVVVAFLTCWLPFHVLTFLNALVSLEVVRDCWVTSAIDAALPFGLLMGFANNCINPLLYYFIGSQFQEKLRRLFKLRLYQFKSTRQSLCSAKTNSFPDAETPADAAEGEEAMESPQTLWVP